MRRLTRKTAARRDSRSGRRAAWPSTVGLGVVGQAARPRRPAARTRRLGAVVRLHGRVRSDRASTSATPGRSTATCCVRTLSATTTSPARRATSSSPTSPRAVPKPTNGGKTYTFHLKSGIKFGPPVNREITSKDIALRDGAAREPEGRRPVRLLLRRTVDQGLARLRERQGARSISGIRTPNATTICFHLTQPTGDFLYRMAMPATGADPGGGREVLHGREREQVRPRPRLVGPVHVSRARTSSTSSSCASMKPASGFDGVTNMTLVRNPSYNPATDSKAARENLPDEFVFTVNSNADDIFNKVAGGPARRRGLEPVAEGPARVRDEPEPEEAPQDRPGRPHVVHHDEPDAAAVRRHPRPQGAELDHGQGRPAEGVGRADRRLDRDAHRARPAVPEPARRATTRTRRPAPPAASRRRRPR